MRPVEKQYLSECTVWSLSPLTVPQYSPVWSYTSTVRASVTNNNRLTAAGGSEGLQLRDRTQGEPSSVCCNRTGTAPLTRIRLIISLTVS